MSDDLHPIQITHIRRMSLAERMRGGMRFLRVTRRFLVAGIRIRHPDWTEAQIVAEERRLINDVRD